MTPVVKYSLYAVAAVGLYFGVIHADQAMQASRPADMPWDASFLQSGYDLSRNEPEGEWVACRIDSSESSDWCRITDQKGSVVYQGDFLPVGSASALPAGELRVISAKNVARMWVQGPVEKAPVPVIRVTGGRLLVPAADRYALEQRWAADPSEYTRLTEAGE